ncbi:MAG: hypothetical protein KF845_01290 [Cyclobacteriaceae bacterium]|nr:hypothetical protein [Cyclobacteriaceae bacterium]
MIFTKIRNGIFAVLLSGVALVFNSSTVYGQITTLSSWTNEYHGTSTAAENVTYPIPAGSGTHRLLVVAIASSRTDNGARTVTLTYGGQTLTSVAGDMASTGRRQHTQLYYLNEAGIDAASNTTLSFTVSGGTTRVTDVFVAVFDGVAQTSPIRDSQNYSSVDNNTTNPVFGTALNVGANDLAIEIISSVRVGNTTPRTITYATNWTMASQQTWTTTDGVRNAIASRSVPTSATTDVSSTTFSGNARGSMTALSLRASQTFYSRQDGDWNNLATWSLTSHTVTNAPSTLPTADDIVLIGGSDVVRVPQNYSASAATVIVGADATNATLNVGYTNNSNNPAVLTISGDITVNNGSTLRVGLATNNNAARTATLNVANVTLNNTSTFTVGSNGNAIKTANISGNLTLNSGTTLNGAGDGGSTNTLNLEGDLINNGTVNYTGNDTYNFNFTGTGAQTISGSGSNTFSNVTLNTGTTNVNVNNSITINGTLTFSTNRIIVVNASSNVTLGTGASISGNNSNRYIQLDGADGNNSQLIKTTGNNTTGWAITYPIGTATGGYTPVTIPTITTAPDNNSTLAVKVIYSSSQTGQLRRSFRFTVAGNDNGTTFSNAVFNYNDGTDISSGDAEADYTTAWRTESAISAMVASTVNTAGNTFTVNGGTLPTATLNTGTYFYTIGRAEAAGVWYSYQNGFWNEPDNWTQDPTGTTLVNPFTAYPVAGDAVTILNGFTITNNLNNQTLSSLTIEGGGILDMAATTGNNLGTVSGSGILRINGIGLPGGNYTDFVSVTGGTIEYYNTGGTLPASQTVYNNLLLSNNTNSPITFISANNLTINSNLNITQTGGTGTVTWQINNTANTQRTVTIIGNITVSANGRIRAGTGNPTNPHNLTLYGNLTNNGSIKFFDDTFATLSEGNYSSGAIYTAAATGRAINVTFTGVANQTVTCNNQTDFYRLIINKGTGQQAMLTVNSSGTSNFRLFGRNNQDLSGAAPNYVSNNNLSIVNGTLQLTGAITIPSLVVNGGGGIGGGWPIPQSGALWINSPDVSIQATNTTDTGDNGRQIYVFGLLRMSSGTLTSGYSRGILGGGSGVIVIEGGTINTPQLRTTYLGSDNRFAYNQSGGTINVGTAGLTGPTVDQYPRFALPYAECTFAMSNGTINVANPTSSGTSNNGGILIFASPSNIQVTGGTINAILPASNTNFTITSTAPFYNLNISKTGATGNSAVILNPMSFNDGTTFARAVQPLTILGDLTIITGGNNPTLNCNSNNLTVGGNLTINNATTLTSGTNTITFNGTGPQTWTSSGTISTLANATVVVNKASGVLTLAGSNAIPTAGNIGVLTLTSGTLDDGGKTVTVTGTLTNNATHTGAGAIVYNNAGASTIEGSNGTFGNLHINTNNTISTAGNMTITGNLRLLGGNSTLFIGSHRLTVLGGIFSNGTTGVAFSGTRRIRTNGLRNDGGLTRQATSAVDLLFPVGTAATTYTPATINVTATTAGTITVKPVTGAHINVTTTGQSVQYYWRVTSTGFSGITNVEHKSYTYANATRDAASVSYRPARYDPATFTWAYGPVYNATAGGGLTTIPNFNTAGWSLGTSLLDGEYTAGNDVAFGTVLVYYSKASGNWSAPATWSTDPVLKHTGANAASAPCATCPVVIGDGASHNHTVTNNVNNQACGSLFIAAGSTLDCANATGLNFGVNTSGTGTLRRSTNSFPAGDFTDFIAAGGGTVEYYGPGYTIPATGPAPQSLNLANYNNLRISPNTGQTIVLPTVPVLTIYNDLIVSGVGTGQASTNITATATRTIEVQGDINVLSGRLALANNGPANATTLIVNGNISVSNGAFMTVNTTGTAAAHTIRILGSIINDGTLNLNGTGNRVANLIFSGDSNTSLTGANAGDAELNLVTINKGTSQAPTVTFDMGGTVTTPSNNWLTLENGTFNYNRPSTSIVLTNANNNPYTIPSTAKLRVEAGTVTISDVNNNNSDLFLSGAIEVAGGTLNIGNGSNSNNDIEYASAGTPTITVSSGSLYVNGSVRRATTSLAGSLVYNQSGGTVTVGGRLSDNTRGVFEIENNIGSSFTMTGASTLTVVRPTNGTAFPDLYLNPSASNVAATATIEVGANALGAQTLDFSISPAIGNITILGDAGHAQTVNMESNPLTVRGTLTINTTSVLNTNSLDVTIGGDLTILGTGAYNGNNNTTTFNGSGAQAGALTANSNFNNITINKPSGTATLSGTTSITDLNILSGILSTPGTLNVNGNIVNNSSQVGTGFIVLTGSATTHTITSANGSFTNLTLGAGAASKNVTVVGDMTINGILNFATTNRYLSIGSNQLTFSSAASVAGAGSTSFVRTHGVASDLGVVRNWPVGSTSFTYPLGTGNSYIPIAFTLDVNALGAGPLTIVPIAQRHPTYNVGSTEQILNYYWIATRGSSLDYTNTGSHVYSYAPSLLSGTGGTLVAGLLDVSNPTGWITNSGTHGGTATTTTMTFANLLNINLPTAGNTFHYTVGTVNTLPNPIIPVYSRLSDASVSDSGVGGAWNSVDSWTTNPSGFGAAVGSPPTGVPVYILPGARINMTTNARVAFTSVINGTLVIGTTSAHNLGIISGTGTLRTATNTFPAGNYAAFVSSAGGTIEYVAPMTMNPRSTYNNLSVFSGSSGTVTMTNTDLILNGSLTVPAGVTLNNASNRNITIAGDWTNNGTFTAGTGTVIFNGATAQNINGTTSFNSLTVSKAGSDLTLAGSGTTTVNGNLTLTNGHLIVPSAHSLTLPLSGSINGGSPNSYISGAVTKAIAASGNVTFPIGKIVPDRYRPASITNTTGSDTWTVEYVGNSPTTDGYPNTTFNSANVATVSNFEYWLVNRSGSAAANLTLSYNTDSYIPPDIGNVANLRVARWDGALWDLPPGGGGFSQSGDNISGTVTVTNVTSFSPFTLASLDANSPLPVELDKFWAQVVQDGVDLFWETASELNNDYFTVERSATGEVFTAVGTVNGKGTTNQRSKYTLKDTSPIYGTSYYRLKQTDFDGSFTYSNVIHVNYDGPSMAFLNVYPNPTNGSEVTIEINGLKGVEEIPVVIYDQLGKETHRLIMRVDGTGFVSHRLVFENPIADGVYIVKAGATLYLTKRLIVLNRAGN